MTRINDIPQASRDNILALACPELPGSPWVEPRPLRDCRIAILTSAALHRRTELPFAPGTAEFRALPASLAPADMLMSHVSINFDRSGFQRDINIAYPIDRLRELAASGTIGAVADTHYSVMGSTDPATMTATADAMVDRLKQERVDAVLLSPV
jgi:D-proline reductase (dithiol) PrdB